MKKFTFTPMVDAMVESWESTMDTPGDADKMRDMVELARKFESMLDDLKYAIKELYDDRA